MAHSNSRLSLRAVLVQGDHLQEPIQCNWRYFNSKVCCKPNQTSMVRQLT